MAKKKSKPDPQRVTRFQKFIIATYVLELLDSLSDEDRLDVDSACLAYGISDWRKEAAEALSSIYGISDAKEFFEAVEFACFDYMARGDSGDGHAFILRGLGCSPDHVSLHEQFITGQL